MSSNTYEAMTIDELTTLKATAQARFVAAAGKDGPATVAALRERNAISTVLLRKENAARMAASPCVETVRYMQYCRSNW